MTDETERELRPAGENPWYVLMTVAGGQPADWIKEDLHARNRRYWNGWAVRALSDAEKARLIAAGRVAEADFEPGGALAPLTEAERAEIEAALDRRCPDADRPEPTDWPVLRGTEFETYFCADGFLFPRSPNFEGARFSGNADFQGATFSGDAVFRSATFSGTAFFESATFSGDAVFRSATFSGTANFESATFSCDADFEGATFSGFAVFALASFSRRADFGGVTFSGYAVFIRATFSHFAAFDGASFSGPLSGDAADFSNAIFEAATSFAPYTGHPNAPHPPRPVRFARPPKFFNATLHEDTDWTDVVWPDPPKDRDEAIAFRRAYERLKLVMAEQNKFADEHFFLRRELACREIAEPGTLSTLASRAFRVLSGHGWSIARPLRAIGIAWAAGAVALFAIELWDYRHGAWPDPETTPPEFLGPGQAMGLSFSNLFAFLGLGWHIMRDELSSLTAVSEIVAAAQMFAGPVLLFLLALGLRNRFRIR